MIQTDHLIQARTLDIVLINKKKRIYQTVDFTEPRNHRVKDKEKLVKYLNLATELRKNMKVIVILIIVEALGQSPRTWKIDSMDRRLEEVLKPFRPQIRYLEVSWRAEETCCHSDFSEKLLVRTGVKNSQGAK